MNNLSIKKTGNVLGILSAFFLLLCMSWGLVLVDPVLKELHINILKIAYPGFSMSFGGAIVGVAWSYVYGYFFGALFAGLCNRICVTKKDHKTEEKGSCCNG